MGAAASARTEVPASLERLVWEAQRGSHDAFALLYRELHPKITGWLRRVNRASASDVDDLFHEIIVRIYRGLRTYDPERGRFLNWVFAVAGNEVTTHRRSRRDVSLLEPDELDRQREWRDGLERSDEESDMDAVLAREEIGSLLSVLTERETEVLVLRYFGDLAISDVAEILGVSANAVSQTRRRAMAKLRAAAASEEGEKGRRGSSVRRHGCRRLPLAARRRQLHVFSLGTKGP